MERLDEPHGRAGLSVTRLLAVLLLFGTCGWAWADQCFDPNGCTEYPGYYCGGHECTVGGSGIVTGPIINSVCLSAEANGTVESTARLCAPPASYLLCGHKFCDGHELTGQGK